MTHDAPSSLDHVLAIHPTKHGFGWVIFNGPLVPLEWGTASVTNARNARCLKRIKSIIERFRPSEIVLEEFEGKESRRHSRIRHLYRSIIGLAREFGIEPRIFSREAIAQIFARSKAKDRYEIACAIAQHVEAFGHLLPPKRKVWDAEDPRMGLFNAAALAITFFALIEGSPFES